MTAVVFSFMNGIVHPYYTVALAPAIAALVGIGATLLWRNRSALPAATALAGIVLVTSILACVLLARADGWLPWLSAVVAVGGVGGGGAAAGVRRLDTTAARAVACLASLASLAAPAAYSVATAATPHTGAIPSVGPSRATVREQMGPGGLLTAPTPGPGLAADAGRRRRRLHVGGGGDGIEQRGGLPIGQRRAGDGDRRLQRNGSLADA